MGTVNCNKNDMKRIIISIGPKLLEEITKESKEEGRSRSNYIVRILEGRNKPLPSQTISRGELNQKIAEAGQKMRIDRINNLTN